MTHRDGHEVRAVHLMIARLFDGPELNQGEDREAASTVRALLAFLILTAVGYLAYFAILDASELRPAILVNVAFCVVYGGGLLALRWGAALLAAVIAVGGSIAQVLVCSILLGPRVGLHLFLIAAGQAVFMVFTDRQRVYRWVFAASSAAVFAYCQFALDPDEAVFPLTDSAHRVLFSVNAAGAGLIVTVLAAVAHARGRVASAEANSAAERARFLANTDPLTGLANRRPVMDELERVSSEGDYSVVVADLDHFKELNDRFGHMCGDRVLAAVGEELRRHVRAHDTVGRWGGEEFIFVLPGTGIGDATGFAERLRAAIEGCAVECGGHVHRVTASFGAADGASDGMSHRVVRRADDAMYEAKAAGRNAVRARPLASTTLEPPTSEVPVVGRREPRARE